jgi:23S rRNA (cytidine1920-2'-O)/16S rRNA (cytidine1409-2'-O)-methyltransferase
LKDRADKVLVFLGLARSRSHAQDLIRRQLVKFKDNLVTKTGQIVEEEGLELLVEENVVGRGALKIQSFLDKENISFDGKVVADIGASTGGFTQVALELGARRVFAVDVGHNQLAEVLKNDDRVVNMEGTNVKNEFHLPESSEFMTVDLSFISTASVLPNLVDKMTANGEILILFKPQFEVGSKNLGARAKVTDNDAVLEKLNAFMQVAGENNLQLKAFHPCGLKGKKSGNQEFFVLFLKKEEQVLNPEIKELP